MASGVRYRYKGKFISASKAARIGNLSAAKKYLTSEYTFKNKGGVQRPGYHKPVDTLVAQAVKTGIKKAVVKKLERVPQTYKERERETRRKVDKKIHDSKVLSYAREAAELADSEDVDIATALDSIAGGDVDDRFIREWYDEIADSAGGIIDYGEEAFDFDMEDLEQEEERMS